MTAKRVFVLGSGFSESLGLPTLAHLFQKMMERDERPGENDKNNVLCALEVLYPNFKKKKSPPAYPPFEEFLSLVYLSRDFEGSIHEDGYWEQKEKSSLRLLIDYIADKSKQAESSNLLKSFINTLKNGDVIITFNWDNLIERSLFEQKKRINFKKRDGASVTVLKLHGSINWQIISDSHRLTSPNSVVWLYDGKICHTKDYTFYDLWDSLDQYPFIVPPVASKHPSANSFLKEIWWEAFNALVEAKQIVIIGYSIPDDDLQSRVLLRVGIMKPYLVIDPNPEVGGKYYTMINPSLKYHQEMFTKETLKYWSK